MIPNKPHTPNDKTADFGFRKVPADQKAKYVLRHFNSIARKYDFMNTLLSFGLHYPWKRDAVDVLAVKPGDRIIDVCGGTADLTIRIAQKIGPEGQVYLYDINRAMMEVGRHKISKSSSVGKISLIQGDALSLPFDDNIFDVAAIAFGIRNIPDRRRTLEEMKRVVVPGGQVMALEMNFPRHPLFRRFYDLYLNRLLPRMARLFSRNPAAYRYLGDSIKGFPSPDHFVRLMVEAGLTGIEKYYNNDYQVFIHRIILWFRLEMI